MPNDKVIIIENPIAKVLAEKRILSNNNSKEKIILSVGRLDANKSQDLLIRAFANVRKVDWKLILIGEGEKKQEYKTQDSPQKTAYFTPQPAHPNLPPSFHLSCQMETAIANHGFCQ